ncbi:hypothetical protein CJF32_00005767 [Rutstroemia sp. NJR-2017a WRK4]|nr:hypothetical protein CJF32_00005767 [Rutstroemia sp. NJR-2017a WRK4]
MFSHEHRSQLPLSVFFLCSFRDIDLSYYIFDYTTNFAFLSLNRLPSFDRKENKSVRSLNSGQRFANLSFRSTSQDRQLLVAKTMAISHLLPDIEVTVDVDKRPLKEYNDDDLEIVPGKIGEHQASRTVAKYIEAVSGKEYSIKVEVGSGYKRDCPTLGITITINGKIVNSWFLRKGRKFKLPYSTRVNEVRTMVDGHAIHKCFRFAELQTKYLFEAHDDPRLFGIEKDIENVEKMGEITVQIHRRAATVKSSKSRTNTFEFSEPAMVHEKALKGEAKSHGTKLGLASLVKHTHTTKYRAEYIDGDDYPIAIYRFKYRSEGSALKSLSIIERTPEPEPEPPVSSSPTQDVDTPSFNIDNLNPSQKAELGKFLASLMVSNTLLRGLSRLTLFLAREVEFGTTKRRKQSGRVEVDLTADDSN